MKLQFVWWWRWPTVAIWRFPRTGFIIFYGLYLGIFEIRYFPKAARKRGKE